MRACVLGTLWSVLQAYSSPLSTLLSAQEPGRCRHQQDPFLGSTTGRHQQKTRDGRVTHIGSGVAWASWQNVWDLPALFPISCFQNPAHPLALSGLGELMEPHYYQPWNIAQALLASLHPVHSTKNTPVIVLVSWTILIRVCHLLVMGSRLIQHVFGWRKKDWALEKVLMVTCASFYF